MKQCRANGTLVNKYENHWTPGKLFDGLGNVTDAAAVDDISANVVILFGFELSQKTCGAVPEDVAARLKQAVKSRRLQSTQRDVDKAAESDEESRQELHIFFDVLHQHLYLTCISIAHFLLICAIVLCLFAMLFYFVLHTAMKTNNAATKKMQCFSTNASLLVACG